MKLGQGSLSVSRHLKSISHHCGGPVKLVQLYSRSLLTLKLQPIVLCTKDVQVKALEELLESLVEKPVSYSWVVNDCMPMGTCIPRTILADQVCKFWPLKVSSTVGEENSWKSECVNHGYQAATLLHPVWTCSPERTNIVIHNWKRMYQPCHATHPQKGVKCAAPVGEFGRPV